MQTEHQPAIRIDFNINASNRLSGTFNKLWQDRNPDQLNDVDQRFPDAPNKSHTVARRPHTIFALRSTLGARPRQRAARRDHARRTDFLRSDAASGGPRHIL